MNKQRAAELFAQRTGTTHQFAGEYLLRHRFSRLTIAYEAFEQEKHKLGMESWQSHLAKRISLADGALKLPAGMDVCTVEQLLESVMARKGLVAAYAHALFARTGWDLHRAVDLYQQFQHSLPPEAWQLVYKLSIRTGMTAIYSRKYLIMSELDYSDALSLFAQDHERLPAAAFAKLPHTTTWLDLPAELRDRIYEFVFDDVQRDGDGHVGIHKRVPGILRVNAQIRTESLKLYLASVSFSANIHAVRNHRGFHRTISVPANMLLEWLDMLGKANVAKIRSLTIIVDDVLAGCSDLVPGFMFDKDWNDEEHDEVLDSWSRLATGLRVRGVQARQLRITSIMSGDFEGCHILDLHKIIARVVFGCVISSRLLIDARLVEVKTRPSIIEEMISDERKAARDAKAGFEDPEKLESMLVREVKNALPRWQDTYEHWLSRRWERLSKMADHRSDSPGSD